jgi:uncharacterized protein YjeT (DUF2065 family)
MTNGFIFVAIGFVVVIGGWSIFLAVALDKSMAEVKKLKQELKDLIPF